MQGKSSLIAEDVQRFPVRVFGCRRVVLALVEEGAGLLAFQAVVVKADAVHGEDVLVFSPRTRPDFRAGNCSSSRMRGSTRSAMAAGLSCSPSSETMPAHRFRVHGLGQNLNREQIVVAVDDQAGKEIALR